MNPRGNTPREKEKITNQMLEMQRRSHVQGFPSQRRQMNTMHNIQEASIVEYMGRSIPRIYAALEDRQAKYQSNMIEAEGKIINHPAAILIDSEASRCYIDPKIVDRLHLEKSMLEKSS